MAYMKDKTPRQVTSKPYPALADQACGFGDTIDRGEMMVHNPDDVTEIAHLQCAIDEGIEIGT